MNYNIRMESLNVYTGRERLTIDLNQELVEGTLQALKNYVIGILGYTTQLYLYREPLSTFSRLHFVSFSASLKDILAEFGQVCFTYNNRQSSQEPDFLSPFPKSSNDLVVIVQTCHQNIFSYERYKIDSKTPISFAKGIASRSASVDHIFVQYYGFRLPMNEFGNEEAASGTIGRLSYGNQSILLTADDQTNNELFVEVGNCDLVNFDEYYIICIEERQIVVSRQADLAVVNYLLSVIFKSPFQIKGYQNVSNQCFQISKNVNKVSMSREAKPSSLVPPLQNSFFVGQTSSYLIFLEQSSILHVYSRFHPFELINSAVLCSQPCNYLQEQIPILLNGQLIMYSITISCIILKYYDLPGCHLRQARHFKWEKEYGLVKADTLDLIAVNFKLNLIRVFYVHAPKLYLEVKKPEIDWFICVGKIGYNVLSDGSGLFGIGGRNSSVFDVYSMVGMQKIASIKLNLVPRSVISASFHLTGKRILITNEEGGQLYDFSGERRDVFKKSNKALIYCFSPNGSIFKATPATFQWLQSVELRVKSNVVISGETALSFNADLQAGDFNQIQELKMNV